MMQDGSSSMGSVPFQDGCSNSSAAYLQRAASAVEAGDRVLGIHLYLAAYERALQEQMVPSDEAIEGMVEAWRLAVDTKQRSLAEYIFEKLEPFWQPDEVARHADELQRMAFDKLEEYGFDRDTTSKMWPIWSTRISWKPFPTFCAGLMSKPSLPPPPSLRSPLSPLSQARALPPLPIR